MLEPFREKVLSDVEVFPYLSAFISFEHLYNVNQIKFEEISLVKHLGNDLFLIKFDYHTNVIQYNKDTKFERSALNLSNMLKHKNKVFNSYLSEHFVNFIR